MKKLHAHQKGFSNLLPLSKSLKPCPQTTPFSLFPSPNASSIWFSRHKDTPDKGHTTDGGRTGVRSQVICLQSLTEREVLKLTSSELEDIWLEGVFIFRFKASPYSIYMNTVSSAMWTGQVCWTGELACLLFSCPELRSLYLWKTRVCENMLIETLQYNIDVYQVFANDMGNYPKLGKRQKRLLGTLSVQYWVLSNNTLTWGCLIF